MARHHDREVEPGLQRHPVGRDRAVLYHASHAAEEGPEVHRRFVGVEDPGDLVARVAERVGYARGHGDPFTDIHRSPVTVHVHVERPFEHLVRLGGGGMNVDGRPGRVGT